MVSDGPQLPEGPPHAPGGAPPESRTAAALRGFGPLGITAMVVITLLGPILEPLGALLALLWKRWSRTPWRELGFMRPRSWIGTIVLGIVLGVALKFVMKALVMPLLGATAINPRYHYLEGNTAALPAMLYDALIGAAFGEEVVFRGFLFERFGKLLGQGPGAKTITVLITATLFGLVHWPGQGFSGAEQAFLGGIAMGALFAATGQLPLLMVTHAAFNLTAIAIIYWGFETRVAHLIFR
jgi:membrane protease YdiL (CAAX protease family)